MTTRQKTHFVEVIPNNCIAGTGNCDTKTAYDAINAAAYEEAVTNTDEPCQFKYVQTHVTPSIRTENNSLPTYVYCLGGTAACAACFAVAYTAELASGAIGAALGATAGTAGGLAGEAAGAVVGAGITGGIAYYILHGTCGWLCSGVVWEPCCFVTCTPGQTRHTPTTSITCY